MNNSHWRQARIIFEQAMEMDENSQKAFVLKACGADRSLLAEVKKLIAADQRRNPLLDQPILQWRAVNETTAEQNPRGLPFNYIGSYRLIRKLGEGGMGEVYLAVEEPVNRKVAIKLILAGLDADYLRRFNDERKALASLNQRNIVTMFASGEASDRPYFVMEYLDGESLRTRMRRGLIPLPEIVEITRQICDALNAAHNRQIVHRDIKPENINLSSDDDGLLVKVLDFGIATLKEFETRTVTDAIVGTAPYLSPEQARGLSRKEIDGRADIYTLGVMVYEMLTGVLPFTASNNSGYYHMHLSVTPTPPSDLASGTGISGDVDYVVMKALAKNPDERHQTAREFARELKEAVERIPGASDPGPTELLPPRKQKLPSRNVFAVAIVLLLLGVGGWWAAGYFSPSAPIPSTSGGQRVHPETPISPGVTSSAPISAPGLEVKIEQEGKGFVPPETVFKNGDAVRLTALSNQNGRLYIIMRGTSGPAEILYPDSRIKGSDRPIQAYQLIMTPSSNSRPLWFRFDNKPGDETLYVVFATQNGDERLQSLENAVRQNRRRLNDAEEGQILTALDAVVAGQAASTTVTAKKILLHHEK